METSTQEKPRQISCLSPDVIQFVANTLLDKRHPRYYPLKIVNFKSPEPVLNERCMVLPSLHMPNLPENYLREVNIYKENLEKERLETAQKIQTQIILKRNKQNQIKKKDSKFMKLITPLKTTRSLSRHNSALFSSRKSPLKFMRERLDSIRKNFNYQKELSQQISLELSDSKTRSRILSRRSSQQNTRNNSPKISEIINENPTVFLIKKNKKE